MVVVEVAVIKDVCSSCSSKSFCSSFSDRISSGHVVVKVTGLLEKINSCSRSSRSGRGKSSFNNLSSNNSKKVPVIEVVVVRVKKKKKVVLKVVLVVEEEEVVVKV